MPNAIDAWHQLVAAPDRGALEELLAEDAIFRSPAVHSPQMGREKAHSYLWAALSVLGPSLTYHRAWHADDSAVLEFTAVVAGLDVHGVDIVTWNHADEITTFTVMVRPVKALHALIEAMGVALAANSD